MLRYILTLFAVACIVGLGVLGWQGKKSKDTPTWGPKLFNNMEYQSKYRPLGESAFFEDGRAARPPVTGTVARGSARDTDAVFSAGYKAALQSNSEYATGKDASGKFIDGFPKSSLEVSADGKTLKPFVLTNEFIALGKQKFDIYCLVCHGPAADGNGIMKKRNEIEGDEAAGTIANLQLATYRAYPNGQVFDVITHGAKTMLSYGDKLTPEERWAVVAYLRALQLSQNCPSSLVPKGVDTTNLK